MASADLELQGEIVARLKADASLSALVAGRIYDEPPEGAVYPYVTTGEAQLLRTDLTCVSGADVYLTLHAWSQSVGFPEVKRIADAVAESLHLAPLSLPTNRLIELTHSQTRAFRDVDGVTSHAVIEFTARVEKPIN